LALKVAFSVPVPFTVSVQAITWPTVVAQALLVPMTRLSAGA